MKAILASVLLLFITLAARSASADATTMYAHFIDVGQANATLLEFAGGTILIDAEAQDDAGAQLQTRWSAQAEAERGDLPGNPGRTSRDIFRSHRCGRAQARSRFDAGTGCNRSKIKQTRLQKSDELEIIFTGRFAAPRAFHGPSCSSLFRSFHGRDPTRTPRSTARE